MTALSVLPVRHPSDANLNRYVDDDLSPSESVRVREHVLVCVRCRGEIQQLGELGERARGIIPPVFPSHVLTTVFSGPSTGTASWFEPGVTHEDGTRLKLSRSGVAAAAIAVFFVGTGALAALGPDPLTEAGLIPMTSSGVYATDCSLSRAMQERVFRSASFRRIVRGLQAIPGLATCARELPAFPTAHPATALSVREGTWTYDEWTNDEYPIRKVWSWSRTVARGALNGTPAWITSTRGAGLDDGYPGSSLDTVYSAVTDLAPLRATFDRLYGEKLRRLVVAEQINGRRLRFSRQPPGVNTGALHLPIGSLFSESDLYSAIGLMPLREGWEGSVELLSWRRVRSRPVIMHLRVVMDEPAWVTTPAGSFECWLVRGRLSGWGPLEDSYLDLYVSKRDRIVVKAMQVHAETGQVYDSHLRSAIAR